jgi:DNA-directed RNA polymerase specialized sigma24 family protein
MNSRSVDTFVAGFQTTRWDLIVAARGDSQANFEALEQLCSIYWPCVYAFVRRKGFIRADAEDLTQEFISAMANGSMLNAVTQDKGRFRSYLAACCLHFLSNRRDAANAQKRGGGIQFVSLDFEAAEIGYQRTLVDHDDPEKILCKKWALALLNQAMFRLERDYIEDGKGIIYQTLHPVLIGDGELSQYQKLATVIGTTEANVQVLVHRMRRKFADLLRDEVRSTLVDPSNLQDELLLLLSTLS